MGPTRKRGTILFNLIVSSFIVCALLLSSSFAYAAADVAYIYDKSFNIDNNVIQVFNNKNLSVETIPVTRLSQTDFSQYRLIFVGNERFRNPNLIPISRYPTIITNYYNGGDWGITDNDGISKIAGSKPLSVKKNGQIIPVF